MVNTIITNTIHHYNETSLKLKVKCFTHLISQKRRTIFNFRSYKGCQWFYWKVGTSYFIVEHFGIIVWKHLTWKFTLPKEVLLYPSFKEDLEITTTYQKFSNDLLTISKTCVYWLSHKYTFHTRIKNRNFFTPITQLVGKIYFTFIYFSISTPLISCSYVLLRTNIQESSPNSRYRFIDRIMVP